MSVKKEEGIAVNIPKIEVKSAIITIVGDSPLIINKFSEKAKREILEKQMKKAKANKEAKVPFADFMESLHWITPMPNIEKITDEKELKEIFEKALKEGAKFGFPSTGIKQSAISGIYRAGLAKNKVGLQGAFHIQGELVEIKGDLRMREDYVKIPSTGTADVVFRAEFDEGWKAELPVTYDTNAVSLEQVIQMLNYGGFNVGIGDWRVEKSGNYGMFHCE